MKEQTRKEENTHLIKTIKNQKQEIKLKKGVKK